MENTQIKDNPEIISNATSSSEKSANVPTLRFELFCVRFTDIATIKGGYAFNANAMSNEPLKYQVIKMGNLYGGNLDLTRNPAYINISDEKVLKESLLLKDDILITLTGTQHKRDYGWVVKINVEKNLVLNQRCAVIRTQDPCLSSYFYYILQSKHFLNQFFNSSAGGTGNQTNVSIKNIENFKLYIHDKKMCLLLGNCLSYLDKRISTQSKIIEDLKLLKKAIMDILYADCKDIKNYGFIDVFTETKELNLSNLMQYTIGKDGIKLMKDDACRYNTDKHIAFSPNTLILGIGIDEIGVSLDINGCCSPIYKTYSINNDLCDTRFIYYFMRRILNKYKRFITQKSTRREFEFDYKSLKKIQIQIPSVKNQKKCCDILDVIITKIEKEKDILDAYKKQKAYLLQKMFI